MMTIRSKTLLVLLVILSAHTGYAALEDLPFSAKYTGSAGAASAVQDNSENIYYNPAAMYSLKRVNICAFSARMYDLDVGYNTFSSTLSANHITWGLGYKKFGNDKYHEDMFCFGIAAPVTKSIVLGTAARYGQISIPGYGSAGALMFDVGGLATSPNFTWGWALRNTGMAKIGQCREELPVVLINGISFRVLQRVQLLVDLYKDVRYPVDYRFGTEWQVFKNLQIRSGFATDPERFTAGFSLLFRNTSLDYSFNTHPWLDFSQFFSVRFWIK